MINLNSHIHRIQSKTLTQIVQGLDSINTLVLFSNSSKDLLPSTMESTVINYEKLSLDVLDIEQRLVDIEKYSTIIGIGGGKICDVSKYIAKKYDKKLILIPTVLSTNAFSTDKSLLFEDGKPTTIQAKCADELYFIENLFSVNPLNVYGLCDVLSIYTALQDWDLSGDKKDLLIYQFAQFQIQFLEENFDYLISQNINAQWDRFLLIIFAGYITNIYGSGKPESGAEHIIAKAIEKEYGWHHGLSVTFGVLVYMDLIKNKDNTIINIALKIGNWSENKDKLAIFDLEHISNNIKPREGRMTILDTKTSIDIENSMKNVIHIINSYDVSL